MSTPLTNQSPPGLTVDDLAAKLAEASANGYGTWLTCVSYRPASPAIGPSPAMPVTDASLGFDWNYGKVFLTTQKLLGADEESLDTVRKRGENLASTHYLAQRILEKDGLSDEDRVTQLKALFARKKPRAPTPVRKR